MNSIALSADQFGIVYNVLSFGLVSMLAIAGGLAFGLGGKDAAARAISHVSDRIKPMQ